MTAKELLERIIYCMNNEDYCIHCKYYQSFQCDGIRTLLEQTALVLEEVIKNGMANN